MSLSKQDIAKRTQKLLSNIGLSLTEEEIRKLKSDNIVELDNQVYKVANVMTNTRYNVIVNKAWFGKEENKENPFFRSNGSGPKIKFDHILFPTQNNLFSIDYLQLRDCCFALELDQDKWFGKSTWGVELDEASGMFRWAGGNTKKFHLAKIESRNALIKSGRITTPLAVDLSEPDLPDRSFVSTYRILRDTKISREIKSTYNHRCQLCGNRLSIGPNQYYSEVHHLKPLGDPHNGPDILGNVVCVCPNCHVMLDYGAIKLDCDRLIKESKHELSRKYIDYHNTSIFKGKLGSDPRIPGGVYHGD